MSSKNLQTWNRCTGDKKTSIKMSNCPELRHTHTHIDKIIDVHIEDAVLLDLIHKDLPDQALQFLKRNRHLSQDVLDNALISACCYGYKFLVQTLVQLRADVECKDTSGKTPLLICSEHGFLDLVHFLISRNANVHAVDFEENTALILSINLAGSKELTGCILEHIKSNINHQNKDGYTALMKAVEFRDIEAAKLLLEGYINPDAKIAAGFYHNPVVVGELLDKTVNLRGETTQDIAEKCGLGHVFKLLMQITGIKEPLELPVETFHQDTLNLWLNCVLDVEHSISPVFHAIFRYIQGGNIQKPDDNLIASIGLLLECGADVSTSIDINPMTVAVEIGSYPLVELLCQYNIETNIKELLKMAAKNGRSDLIELILRYKGDANSFNYSYSDSPLEVAVSHCQGECARLLSQHGACMNINYALNSAVQKSSAKYLNFLLQNYKREVLDFLFLKGSENATSLLISAVKRGHLEILRIIIDLGVDINDADFMGVTPLMEASSPEVAQFLIQKGADVNKITRSHSRSNTPLIHFTENSYFNPSTSDSNKSSLEVVRLLLKNGATVNTRNEDGRTPLMIAATKKVDVTLLELLIEHGAETSDRDGQGNTAVFQAVVKGCVDNVATLIKCTKDKITLLNLQNNQGLTALMAAVISSDVLLVSELIIHGADVNVKDIHGNTALLLALKSARGSEEMLTTLLKADSDVNWQNNNGLSPLMLAVKLSRINFVSILLDSGADVNAVSSKDGRKTAVSFLHKNLYRRDSIQILELLAEKGATCSYVSSFILYQIICEGHIATLPKLLKAGLGPTEIDGDERLMRAVRNGTIPPVSPLCLALLVGNARLAHYFWGNLFLTKYDLLPLTSNKVIKSFLQVKHYQDCLNFLAQISSEPISLFQLAFVEVTSAIGSWPGRETRVNQLPLPRIIRDKLLFRSEIVNLATPSVTQANFGVFSEAEYDHLAGISYLNTAGL